LKVKYIFGSLSTERKNPNPCFKTAIIPSSLLSPETTNDSGNNEILVARFN
jgi:hypothetical protein